MPDKYQWETLVDQQAAKRLSYFKSDFGLTVQDRYADGKAKTVSLAVYTSEDIGELYVVGEFNDWGRSKLLNHQLGFEDGFYSFKFESGELKHKDTYLLVRNGVYIRDPACKYFDEQGRCVFWDFGDPKSYQRNSRSLDLVNRPVKILQTDLAGLVTHFRSTTGKLGHEVDKQRTYRFIAESGVIDKVADLGFNTIQFLPISQSIDGDKWSHRYLVPYLYSVDNRWGDPDEFVMMVDTFHKKGIAVILDHVISHAPDRRFRVFDTPNKLIGIHRWVSEHGDSIYLGEETNWGTRRYQYHNELVRRYVVQSSLSLLKDYRIDGFRIDNVDGILRHGPNGDGDERIGGRELLRELASSIYEYKPHAYINLESHYFHGDNAKDLVDSLENPSSVGATAYTSSRLTHYLHQEYMPKSADHITPWKIKDIIDEKEWGRSNSTVADFHNHDAAAGLMPMRATGSYAYDALILKDPSLHYHAIGKIKVMEALISLVMEGRSLDLLQTFLLQTGSFEHDNSVKWYLERIEASRAMLNYKREVNRLVDEPAFWPLYVGNRKVLNLDEESKTLGVSRSGKGGEFIIFLNLAGHMLFDFVIPVSMKGTYSLVLNSDRFELGGSGRTDISDEIQSESTNLFELFDQGLRLGTVAPYQVIVFKRKRN